MQNFIEFTINSRWVCSYHFVKYEKANGSTESKQLLSSADQLADPNNRPESQTHKLLWWMSISLNIWIFRSCKLQDSNIIFDSLVHIQTVCEISTVSVIGVAGVFASSRKYEFDLWQWCRFVWPLLAFARMWTTSFNRCCSVVLSFLDIYLYIC